MFGGRTPPRSPSREAWMAAPVSETLLDRLESRAAPVHQLEFLSRPSLLEQYHAESVRQRHAISRPYVRKPYRRSHMSASRVTRPSGLPSLRRRKQLAELKQQSIASKQTLNPHRVIGISPVLAPLPLLTLANEPLPMVAPPMEWLQVCYACAAPTLSVRVTISPL